MDDDSTATRRDSGRTSVAVVAEESEDGAYEFHVTTGEDGTPAPEPAIEEGGMETGRAASAGRVRTVGLLAVAAVLTAVAVLAIGGQGAETGPAVEPSVDSASEGPTFRAWIVPADPSPTPAADETEEHAEPEWQGVPQVAGVVYRGPDAEGDDDFEEEGSIEPDRGAVASPSDEPVFHQQRPVLDLEPARLPERWAPSEPVRIDPAVRHRLERVPILALEPDHDDDIETDPDEWQDEALLDDDLEDENYIEDDELLDDEIDEDWED